MKILILANPANPHTIKWANSLNAEGIEVYLFGLNKYDRSSFNENIKIEIFNVPQKLLINEYGSFSKIFYLASLIKIKNYIKKIKPDILHAHYISSYGLLGALTNFHPYFISVWGSDIYNVPQKNFVYRKLIEHSLNKADRIMSTSFAMAHQTKRYTKKEISVIPFGIDTDKFKPMKVDSIFKKETFIIGTIKTLEKKYGIEYLIRAFNLVKEKLPSITLKLLIVGSGKLDNYLKKLTAELNLENDIIFTGYIAPDQIPRYHNMLDIYAALSIEDSESFGVAALEASACEKPVVVSDVSGFAEVVKNNITGFVVERKNIQLAADAMIKLVKDKALRDEMGRSGREHVKKMYSWNNNVKQMINIYKQPI